MGQWLGKGLSGKSGWKAVGAVMACWLGLLTSVAVAQMPAGESAKAPTNKPANASAPQVVATIAPLHSLVAAVMDGVGTPTLLLKGRASPHDYALRPSDARAIEQAQTVFWIGPALEGFMVKTLASAKVRNVALASLMPVQYPPRSGGVWQEDAHDHGHSHAGHDHDHDANIDPHLWLDPRNAQAMVEAITRELVAIDPAHTERYQTNAAALRQKLTTLDQTLTQTLAPAHGIPFIVFHDAYQYFEKRYDLNGVGSITIDPDQKPSAKRLQALRSTVRSSGVACVFAEPQFGDALIGSVIEGSNVRRGTLDPLGSAYTPGPEAYIQTLQGLADAARRCLLAPAGTTS